MSTKVDTVYVIKYIYENVFSAILLKRLVESHSRQYKVNYNSQKFPGRFYKAQRKYLILNMLIYKSAKKHCRNRKTGAIFLELDKRIDSEIHCVIMRKF